MSRVEFSDGRGMSAEALRSLAKAAGMSMRELVDDVEAGGQAALRRAAERAGRRRRDPRQLLLELLRRRNA